MRERQFSVILGEMIEVVVDQDQVLEQVPIEIEIDVSNVGNMITLLKVVQTCQRQKKDQTEQMMQMLDSEEQKTALKHLTADTYEGWINANSEETIYHLKP